MKMKHLNIKPKVFPVPCSSMASSYLTSYLNKKKKSWPLENGISQNTTDYVLVQNGLFDWMLSEKACYASQHESAKVNKCNENGRRFSWRQKKRKIFMETKEKKNILIQLWSYLYDYVWKWTLVCTVTITSILVYLSMLETIFFHYLLKW